MIRIDTDIPEITVEIEDREYPLAPRTVDTVERLNAAERDMAGKPFYRLWMAQLEVLLGKEACRELFGGGKAENLDRMQVIYDGVTGAFLYKDNEIAQARREKNVEAVAAALAPLNEMLRHIRALDREKAPEGQMRAIPRVGK